MTIRNMTISAPMRFQSGTESIRLRLTGSFWSLMPCGGASVAVQQQPDAPYGPWTRLGGQLIDSPTAVATRDGRLVVAAVHADDVLRERTRRPDGSWTGWADVG